MVESCGLGCRAQRKGRGLRQTCLVFGKGRVFAHGKSWMQDSQEV